MKVNAIRSALALAVGAVVMGSGMQSAMAQIEEVLVTAQRKQESLQDVPVAVSAFSPDDIQNLGVVETLDIAKLVPNFVAHNNTGLGTANTYSLRGLNNTESIATFDPPVGTYIDDYFIQRQNSNNYALFDIDRVEVLRGPQGTLFGRNTTAGAVRVILRKPQDEFGGFFEASYGRFGRTQFRGTVHLPVNDRVRTSVSAYWIEDDGFVTNLTTGEDDLNSEENFGLRGAVDFDVTEDITWHTSVTYINSDHANMYNSSRRNSSDPRIGSGRYNATGLTTTGAPLAGFATGGKQFFGLGNQTESYHWTSDIEWQTALGTVNILTSYMALDQDFLLDFFDPTSAAGGAFFPGTPRGQFVIANSGDHNQWTQEVKLTGSAFDDKVDYTAGFFYFNEDNDTDFIQAFTAFGLVSYDRLMTNETSSWAVYAKADWHVLETVTLSAGLRYTDEEKDYGVVDNGNPATPAAAAVNTTDLIAAGIPTTIDEQIVTPRFSLEWRPNDDLMFYGSATRGFKSGGWNARSGPASQQTPFDSEIVWSYEIGARTEWFDNRLRANITAFYTDVEDFQLPSAFNDPGTGAIVFITQNFADVEVKGLELEFLAAPVENLTLYTNIGLLDSEYQNLNPAIIAQQDRCRNMAMNCAEGIVNETGGIADPVRAPDYQIAAGGWYDFRLTPNMTLTPRVNVTRYGEHNTSTSGQLVAIVDGYTLVSGGITLAHAAQDWQLSVECRNCTDRDYFVSFLAGTQYLSDPMTWMARFTKRF